MSNLRTYLNPKYLKNPIVTGTLLLTLAGLAAKLIGFFYRIFLSRIFHEEGLGVIGLIAPVMVLVHSVCAGGLQNAVTRFVAASKREKASEGYAYLFTGIAISMFLSAAMSYAVFHHAPFIARTVIGEPRCVPLLQISALSFPLASLHCCINGFFYGRKQAGVPALSMLIEQITRVVTVYLLYTAFVKLAKKMIIRRSPDKYAFFAYPVQLVNFFSGKPSDRNKRVQVFWNRIHSVFSVINTQTDVHLFCLLYNFFSDAAVKNILQLIFVIRKI